MQINWLLELVPAMVRLTAIRGRDKTDGNWPYGVEECQNNGIRKCGDATDTFKYVETVSLHEEDCKRELVNFKTSGIRTLRLTNDKLSKWEAHTDSKIGDDNTTPVATRTRDGGSCGNFGDTTSDDETGGDDSDTTRVTDANC